MSAKGAREKRNSATPCHRIMAQETLIKHKCRLDRGEITKKAGVDFLTAHGPGGEGQMGRINREVGEEGGAPVRHDLMRK